MNTGSQKILEDMHENIGEHTRHYTDDIEIALANSPLCHTAGLLPTAALGGFIL